jgi:hypothetical protein
MLQTFAEFAPDMRREGWAVLPSTGKAPLKKGFNTWKRAPGISSVERWAKCEPDADIVIVAGLCETGRGKRGVIVVDPDDEDAIGRADEIFGETPGKVRTRRGAHRYFDGAGINLGKLANLRDRGLNIDIKHGQRGAGIVAAPPSPHEKDRSFRYAYEGCDETVIRHLPPFPVQALQRFLEKHPSLKKAAENTAKPATDLKLRDSARKQGLNDYLVSQVCFCTSFDELLDVAHTWNRNLSEHGYEPLEDAIVVSRANTVWGHHLEGRFEPMLGRDGVAKTKLSEIDLLLGLNPKYAGDANMLLTKLKIEHSARCRRGESFPVCVKAMARDNVLSGWTRERYQNAKDLLLTAGLLKCVSEFRITDRGRDAALYTL